VPRPIEPSRVSTRTSVWFAVPDERLQVPPEDVRARSPPLHPSVLLLDGVELVGFPALFLLKGEERRIAA
jgi:hypothetical protein